ncbi:MAG: hypothetical protein M0Z68_11080 [Gammaproteobacteria bacterium]|nr:hypothetical protein [Gammaproteobacteria bacterium]
MEQTSELLTINQFCERHPAFSVGGIRSALFYRGDIAEQAGAIARFGRRILIDEGRFLAWVRTGGAKVLRGRA